MEWSGCRCVGWFGGSLGLPLEQGQKVDLGRPLRRVGEFQLDGSGGALVFFFSSLATSCALSL